MVKIQSNYEGLTDPKAIEKRTQFLHDFGLLIGNWNLLELYIEIIIWRKTGMSAEHCAIVLGSLQHKAKVSILKSLLNNEGNAEAVSKLKTALSYAQRNALVHGVPGSEEDGSEFGFFYRSVDDKYMVKSHKFTAEEFHKRVYQFFDLAHEAIEALGINENDPKFKAELDEYCKGAKFDL
jgi:hypothetical protein